MKLPAQRPRRAGAKLKGRRCDLGPRLDKLGKTLVLALGSRIQVQRARDARCRKFLPRDGDPLDVVHVVVTWLIREQAIVRRRDEFDAEVLQARDDMSACTAEPPPCFDWFVPPAADKKDSRVFAQPKLMQKVSAPVKPDESGAAALKLVQRKGDGLTDE